MDKPAQRASDDIAARLRRMGKPNPALSGETITIAYNDTLQALGEQAASTLEARDATIAEQAERIAGLEAQLQTAREALKHAGKTMLGMHCDELPEDHPDRQLTIHEAAKIWPLTYGPISAALAAEENADGL